MKTANITRKFTSKVRFPGRDKLLRKFYDPDKDGGNVQGIVKYQKDMKMYVDTRFFIEWVVFFKGFYEPFTTKCILNNIKKGDTCIDVGANIGVHSLTMANKVGPEGKIYSFEPHPDFMKRLLRNVALNSFNWVTTKQIALGSKKGKAVLYSQTDINNKSASLLAYGKKENVDKFDVEVKPLDSFGLKRCNLIKIDTDGFDYEVLRGAVNTIKKFKPTIIFEHDSKLWGERGGDLGKARKILKDYKLSSIGDGNILAKSRGSL